MEAHPAAARGACAAVVVVDLRFMASRLLLQCFDNKGISVATWERGQLEDEFHARLSIKHAGLSVVTEILTTLTLNRIAHALSW